MKFVIVIKKTHTDTPSLLPLEVKEGWVRAGKKEKKTRSATQANNRTARNDIAANDNDEPSSISVKKQQNPGKAPLLSLAL